MEPNQLHRVNFDFRAEEDGEVSVAKGELVVTLPRGASQHRSCVASPRRSWFAEEGADLSDGWALVETAAEPRRSGFVPAAYLVRVSQSAPAPAPAPRSNPQASTPSSRVVAASIALASSTPMSAASSTPGSARGVLSPASPTKAHDSLALTTHPVGSDVGGGSAEASAAMKSEEFAHLFEAHDQWFRQALSRRQETFKTLNSSVSELSRRLVEGESRAKTLAEKLGKLEGLVEQERARWADQLEKERAALGDALALTE
jgi:hypothetical protein